MILVLGVIFCSVSIFEFFIAKRTINKIACFGLKFSPTPKYSRVFTVVGSIRSGKGGAQFKSRGGAGSKARLPPRSRFNPRFCTGRTREEPLYLRCELIMLGFQDFAKYSAAPMFELATNI